MRKNITGVTFGSSEDAKHYRRNVWRPRGRKNITGVTSGGPDDVSKIHQMTNQPRWPPNRRFHVYNLSQMTSQNGGMDFYGFLNFDRRRKNITGVTFKVSENAKTLQA